MKKKIKHLLKKIIFIILYWDKKIYYADYHNSLNFVHLIFWNLIRPGRLLTRIKYNRFMLPRRIKKIDNNTVLNIKNLSKNEIIEISAKKLKKYGTVTLNQYYNELILSRFEDEYKNYFNKLNYQPSNYFSNTNILPLSKNLADLWFDETITSIIEKYIKRLPVAAYYPIIQSVTPKYTNLVGEHPNRIIKSELADKFHLDHSTFVQAAIYFTDVDEGTPHTEVVLGTHTYPNLTNPLFLSKEYVSKNNLTVKKNIGKRGSVVFHCGNVFHRLCPVQNSTRTWLKFGYTSGNNITLDSERIGIMLKNGFKLSSLDNRSRTIASGLFPLPLTRGYEINKKSFKRCKFQGF